ncbi:MAG: HEAT repeat domain-containing protein [Chloroflexota bacterium]|nr:HEAT repeat domain-containing protein [Chloroflexota bacterium]
MSGDIVTIPQRVPVTSWFRSALNVQVGEEARVGVMILYSAAAIGGVLTVGMTVASALFLSGLAPSFTPYLFILSGFTTLPILLLYNRVAVRFPLDQIAIGTPLLLLLIALAFRLLLGTPLAEHFLVLASLYLFVVIAATLVRIQFWTFAGQIFNPREAKRLFGLIAAGGTISSIIAGFSLAALSRIFGAPNLLFIVVAALGTCMTCAWLLGQMLQDATAKVVSAPSRGSRKVATPSLWQDVRALLRSPLLLDVGVLIILQSLLVNVAAYQFYLALQSTFQDRSQDMVAFLGAYEFWAGIGAFFLQFYLTGRVMSRWGLFAALAFYPLGIALGEMVALLMGGAMVAMALVRAMDPLLRRTINDAAMNALFLPISPELRERSRQLLEATYAFTFGLAGIGFVLLQAVPDWTYLHYAIPMLLLAVAWLVLLRRRARGNYLHALQESLSRRRLHLDMTVDVADETTWEVLRNALRHPDEMEVIHALHLIERAPNAQWTAHLVPLLDHPSPEVRILALRLLGREGDVEQVEQVATLLSTSDEAVRAAAIDTYSAIVGTKSIGHILPFLEESNPRIQGAAVVALIRYGGIDGVLHAAPVLKALLESPEPAAREAGARVLADLEIATFYAPLIPLLDDPDIGVRASAIRAAGVLRRRELLPHLLHNLEDKAVASTAADALAYYGEIGLPLLDARLADAAEKRDIRIWVPRILWRIGTLSAAEVLVAHLREADDAVRLEVYRALARLPASERVSVQTGVLQEALLAELREYYIWYVTREDINAEGEAVLLDDAFRARMKQALDRIIYLFGIYYPEQRVERERLALHADSPNARAMAIELLDNLAYGEVKMLLLPLLEAPPETVLALAEKHFDLTRQPTSTRLAALAQDNDPWLRACAIYQIGVREQHDLYWMVSEALAAEDPLVRETALAVSRKLVDRQRWDEVLHAQGDAPFPSVRHYAQAYLNGKGGSIMLSTIERVLFLQGVELFREIPGEALIPVAAIAEEVTFELGETFIRQGEVGDCLYVIVAGEVSVVISELGEVVRRGSRDIIGEMAIISHQPRSADCIALTDVTALRIDQGDFWELLSETPLMARGIIRVLTQKLNEAVANMRRRGEVRGSGEPLQA